MIIYYIILWKLCFVCKRYWHFKT